jgi:hypothetical protein
MKLRTAIASSALVLLLSACATPAPDPVAGAAGREVPSLKVVADCGACNVRPSVQHLIVEGYHRAAAESGAKVVASQEATVTIKEYSARDDAARFLVGVFAGKDEIKATVTSKDKKFEVEDYYMNRLLGIDALARKIGGMIFEQVTQQ